MNLNGTGSTGETWHVELAADAPYFTYEPGDAIGVLPENDPHLAGDLAAAVGLGGNADLQQRLTASYDITTLSRPLVDAYARLTGRTDVASLTAEPEALKRFAADRQLIDLFATFPERLTAEQLHRTPAPVAAAPLLGGIEPGSASRRSASAGRRGALDFARPRSATASLRRGWPIDKRPGDAVRIYVKRNRHFRLPKDEQRPIIMIGAGTGVAPFRAFVEQRAEAGIKSPSWLFFGARNYTNDFLYQLEWQEHLQSGALGRIDVAFSRDQPEKIYIQHRLWEQRKEVRRWIADGAHVYVCGDEKGMGRDVDAMLARILAEGHGGDIDSGKADLDELTKTGRYQRDVY